MAAVEDPRNRGDDRCGIDHPVFYRNKAKYIKKTTAILHDAHRT